MVTVIESSCWTRAMREAVRGAVECADVVDHHARLDEQTGGAAIHGLHQ
jgi:hypothetical protein